MQLSMQIRPSEVTHEIGQAGDGGLAGGLLLLLLLLLLLQLGVGVATARLDVAVLRKGGHELGVAGRRRFAEVRRLQTLLGRGALGRVVHEQEVEEAQAGRAQVRKLMFQVVVRLLRGLNHQAN